MLAYIKKYENFPMIDSVRYREISRDLSDKKNGKDGGGGFNQRTAAEGK
jgi:hypothetical protein